MPPLPVTLPAKYDQHPNLPSIENAYERCRHAEHHYENRSKSESTSDPPLALICVRIVGYLLYHTPTGAAVDNLVADINSCEDDAALCRVGRLFLSALTRAFKGAAECRTPPSPDHAPRPSFDTLTEMANDFVKPAPLSHVAAKRSALSRDGFRCMLTGKYDARAVNRNAELTAIGLDLDATTLTECAHIFSESTNVNIEPGSDKREWAASMWAVMSRFGHESLPDELNGALVHRLENVLTLEMSMHRYFDALEFWFVATDLDQWVPGRKNIYKIEATPANARIAVKYPKVTFTTKDDKLPLPSPEYLALHAACCKVAHLSGASEWFQQYDDDMDEHLHKSLAVCGASAHLLSDALS